MNKFREAYMYRYLLLSAACVLLSSGVAAAQEQRAWFDVNFGVGAPTQESYGQQISLLQPQYFPLFGEPATYSVKYSFPDGPMFDVGGGAYIGRRWGVGLSVARRQRENGAHFGVRLPHPAFTNDFSTAEADLSPELSRNVIATNFPIVVDVLNARVLQLRVFGGPSYLKVTQDVVRTVSWHQEFDSADRTVNLVTLTGYEPDRTKEDVWGVHAGVDAATFFTPSIGVGVFARFTRGRAELAHDLATRAINGTAMGALQPPTVRLDALEWGSGLRIRF
jgi:hypothetical protein